MSLGDKLQVGGGRFFMNRWFSLTSVTRKNKCLTQPLTVCENWTEEV